MLNWLGTGSPALFPPKFGKFIFFVNIMIWTSHINSDPECFIYQKGICNYVENSYYSYSSDLGHELIEQLSLYFNPRLLGKDYRSLAGKMGLSHLEVKNLDRLDNPTEQLLNIWVCSSSEGRTVTDLIEIFAKIKRHDAINLIQKHEFQGKCFIKWYYTVSDDVVHLHL